MAFRIKRKRHRFVHIQPRTVEGVVDYGNTWQKYYISMLLSYNGSCLRIQMLGAQSTVCKEITFFELCEMSNIQQFLTDVFKVIMRELVKLNEFDENFLNSDYAENAARTVRSYMFFSELKFK